jgi:PKD repeat protein
MKRFSRSAFLILVLMFVVIPSSAPALPDNGSGSGYITVTNPPVADFFTSTRYGAAPFMVSFSDSSLGFLPMTWQWDFGDGSSSVQQNPTHTYRYDGEYTVRLTVTNQYGISTKTVPAFIGVGNPPVAAFSASPAEGTIPLVVSFTDKSTGRPTAWHWEFGDGSSSSDENPVHTYTQPGRYTAELSVSNNFGSDSAMLAGIVNASSPLPVPVTMPAEPVPEKQGGIAGLILEARGTAQKDLPTSAYIPPQFMALAAVLTSIAILVIQVIVANVAFLWQILLKFSKFFAELLGEHVIERIDEREREARRIEVRKLEPHFLGLSSTEVLVIEFAILIVALAFLLADRAELTLEMVLIYLAVGAVSVVLHDFAHRYFASKHGQDADTQFWGLGTVIMFLTAWLFGNAFAQPYRNLVNRNDDGDPQRVGIEMVAGPLVSIFLTFFFLGMVMLGGVFAVAGGIGFVINLITAVYSLMPIETMDGLAIWRWNRGLYLVLIVPMFLFYCYVFMLV